MPDVFLKFRYVERDVVDALRLQIRRKRTRGLEVVGLGASVLAVAVCWPIARSGGWRTMAWLWGGALVLLAALAVTLLVVLPRVFFRSRPDLQGPMGVDVSDDGIAVTAGERGSTIRWPEVARVDTDARICAIHHGERVLLVPRRVFRSERQQRSFFEWLERAQASRENRRAESGKSTPSANQ